VELSTTLEVVSSKYVVGGIRLKNRPFHGTRLISANNNKYKLQLPNTISSHHRGRELTKKARRSAATRACSSGLLRPHPRLATPSLVAKTTLAS
jgi:hypothetical protein